MVVGYDYWVGLKTSRGCTRLAVAMPEVTDSIRINLFKRTSGTLKNVVGGIDEWAKGNDAAALKLELSKRMDVVHKNLVGKMRNG